MVQRIRILLLVLILGFLGLIFNQSVSATPNITAPNYILVHIESGEILAERAAYEERPPASLTKILTGITAIDLGHPSELVLISKKAASIGDASIYLQAGEVFTLGDLIEGALIKSGNDAASAIAEHIAGDEELFMELSNRKARILGAVNTYFFNPHGLPDDRHLTTAYDLALITIYSLKNPIFSKVVATKEVQIISLNTNRKVILSNTNRLLWTEGVLGVKTGTTNAAGKCLVSAANNDDVTLLTVVLKSGDRFSDTQKLFYWGFNNLVQATNRSDSRLTLP